MCEKCGITDWMGKDLTLQLHHVDGNRQNNSLDNLEILCPNCHSQTDNYCGKSSKKDVEKKKKKVKNIKEKIFTSPPISRDELKKMIYYEAFVNIGKTYGVSDNAIRKWCDKYGLPRNKKDIRKYSIEEWEKI